jgi:hypothetical protein
LFVVPPSAPLDSNRFPTFSDAYQAAVDGDTIQMEPGTLINSVGAGVVGPQDPLSAPWTVGNDTLTIDNTTIRAGEMVNISGGAAAVPGGDEVRLVKSSRLDPSTPGAFVNTLTLDKPLANDHSGTGNSTVASVTVGNGSSLNIGYSVGDIVVLSGGTLTTPAIFSVASVGGLFGTATSLNLINPGSYSVTPGTTAIATTTNGHGSGLAVNLTYNAPAATVTSLGIIGIDKSLTIQGDLGTRALVVSDLEVLPGTTGVTFQGINYLAPDPVTLDVGSSQTKILNSILTPTATNGLVVTSPLSIAAFAPANQVGNVLDGNILNGSVAMNAWKSPQITNNVFAATSPGSFMLEGTDAHSPLIQGNTFTVNVSAGTAPRAIRIFATDNVQILNNSIRFLNASGLNEGIEVFSNSDVSRIVPSLTIKNNVIDTNGGTGIGVATNAPGVSAASLVLTIVGNDFHNNSVGIDIAGDGTNSGSINVGDGTPSSLGGNNFRSFTVAGAATGKFAIYEHNTSNAIASIPAQNNIWSVPDPNTVIRDGSHNTPGGTGLINVGSTQLTANQDFVQTLYLHYLGRTGQVSELNGWVAGLASLGRFGVANAIAHSDEALRSFVDHAYLKFLGRPAEAAGEVGWVLFFKNGGTEEQIITNFLTSPEYFNHVKDTFGGVDSSYIQSLYNNLLGRTAGSDEVAGWVNVLPSIGRASIVNLFVHSAEYRGNAIRPFYVHLLHRPTLPSDAEVAVWVNTSMDLFSIEIVFTSTDEYYFNG